MSEQNKQVVRRLFEEAWSTGNLGALDDIVDPGYRSHIEEASVARMSHWTGPQIPRVEIAAYRSGLPDLQATVATLLAEGDEVVVVWELTGTNTGRMAIEPFEGVRDEEVDPTGEPVQATGTARFRLTDGKIAEAEFHWQPLGPLDQIRLFASGRLEVNIGGHDATLTLAKAV